MELTEKYTEDGVVIMEVQQEATSQEDLINWGGAQDYLSVRTEPPKQLETDYRKTEVIPTMCVFVVIDLHTMKVLESNCGQCTEHKAEPCIDKHLN